MSLENQKTPITYAFIDGENLHLGVKKPITRHGILVHAGGELDYRKFRNYLRTRYGVKKAYIFLGNIPTNKSLYFYLQDCGFELIMKDVVYFWNRKKKKYDVKGNVDTDIVLYSVGKLFSRYTDAVFVSGDGDFISTYDYVAEKGKLKAILAPNRYNYSSLLNKYHKILHFVSNNTTLMKPKRPGVAVGIKALGMPGHRDTSIIAKPRKKVNKKDKK